jgi:hypothetical protein
MHKAMLALVEVRDSVDRTVKSVSGAHAPPGILDRVNEQWHGNEQSILPAVGLHRLWLSGQRSMQ